MKIVAVLTSYTAIGKIKFWISKYTDRQEIIGQRAAHCSSVGADKTDQIYLPYNEHQFICQSSDSGRLSPIISASSFYDWIVAVLLCTCKGWLIWSADIYCPRQQGCDVYGRVCLSVCQTMCPGNYDWTPWPRNQIFGMYVGLHHIWVKFEWQYHWVKFKVIGIK